MTFWPEAWAPILVPEAAIAELLVRGTAVYLVLFFLLRVIPPRQLGRFAISDLLVLLLLASAVRMGLTGQHYTVGDALISGVTLLAWDAVMNVLAVKSETLRRFMRQDPAPVVREGEIQWKNARRALLTEKDIRQKLREHGVADLGEVGAAYIEPDGRISVIRRGAGGSEGQSPG